MIIGIGHDVTDVRRVATLLGGKAGARFMERVLAPSERELASGYRGARLEQFVAGRFAAKEAVAKAFGCGIGSIMSFAEIEIARDSCGKPVCLLGEEVWARLGHSAEHIRIWITITHERELASAFAVAEQLSG